MDKQQIYDYIINSPDNTNPNVLRSLLDNMCTEPVDPLQAWMTGELEELNSNTLEIIKDRFKDPSTVGPNKLKRVILPNCTSIEYEAFINAEIEELYLPKLEKTSGGAFNYATIPDTVFENLTSIETNDFMRSNGGNVEFTHLTNLSLSLCNYGRIALPEATEIQTNQFSRSTIGELYLPKVTTIKKSGFSNLNIKKLELPSLKFADESSMCPMQELEYVDLGKIMEFGHGMFYTQKQIYNNLKTVIIRNDSISTIQFYGYGSLPVFDSSEFYPNLKIYVPRDKIELYLNSVHFTQDASKILPLEDYTDDGTVDGKFIG